MSITFINTDYRWGFHIRKVSPSLLQTFEFYKDVPFSCFQIFVSTRSWTFPEYSNTDLLRSGDFIRERNLYLCIHGNLLYNLCGSVTHKKDPRFHSKLKNVYDGLTAELDICVALGAGVVVHPGSCKDKKKGIEEIANTIKYCLTQDTSKGRSLAKDMKITFKEFKTLRKIILENAAGEGTKLAVTLEEISSIIKLVPDNLKPQVRVCIDTAHAFGAGLYRWGDPEEVSRFYRDFDKIIGLQYLEVFHLNDSRASEKKGKNAFFGSRKDRHEYLGLGYIFGSYSGKNAQLTESLKTEGLKEFFFQARDRQIPIIGEPPHLDRQGNLGDGGRREWRYISNLLSKTNCPLET